MKAITIHQPWASLIAHGYKKFETRSWHTNYRGPIAIHASKANPEKQMPPYARSRILLEIIKLPSAFCLSDLPTGCILAVGKLRMVRIDAGNYLCMDCRLYNRRIVYVLEPDMVG